MKLTIASWNILNDYWAKHGADYPLQRDRLPQIIKVLLSVKANNERMLLFVCELEAENAEKLSKATGLVLIDMYEYSRLATLVPTTYSMQNIAFYADAKTAKIITIQRIRTVNRKRDAIAEITIAKSKLIGTHIPQRPFIDFFTRRAHRKTILKQKPTIVMGDFNATPLFPTRWRFLFKKYTEVHKNKRPMFPHPYFRGRNISNIYPDMNIDVIFAKKDINYFNAGSSLTSASDHPLIWVSYEV
jgi:Endonuclease/Exonuclease/phosphatase family